MMTVEERMKMVMGEQQFQIIYLATKLEAAEKRIAELEATAPHKPDLKTVRTDNG